MSQNQGGLSEDELRDYINDKYSLRLERDVFIKPNKDVIVDIYQRFLDEVCPFWRRYQGTFKDCEEPAPIKAIMVKFLKAIVRIYNNSYTLNITDLISPTRQRTRLTLNILIYHRERVQDILGKFQDDKEELMLEQEEVLQKKQEIAQLKERVEELAIAISTSRPVEELRSSIINKENELDPLKKLCDEIADEAKDVKSKVVLEREVVNKEKVQAEERNQEINKLKKQLEILNKGLNLGTKAAEIERLISDEESQLNAIRANIAKAKKGEKELERLVSIQRLFENEGARYLDLTEDSIVDFQRDSETRRSIIEKLKHSILEHQRKEETMQKRLADLEMQLQDRDLLIKTDNERGKICFEARKSEIKDRERALLKEEAQEVKEIEETRRIRSGLKLKLNEELEKHKRFIERADRKVSLLEEKYEKSKEQIEQNLSILAERKDKINTLVGGVERAEITLDMPANRTYIKSQEINN